MKNNGEQLFSALDEAIHAKGIINPEHYKWKEVVEVKHGTTWGPWKGDPYYTYHDKWQFNHVQYDHDVNQAEHRINLCRSAITNKISEFRQLAANSDKQADKTSSNITHYNSEIAKYKNQLGQYNTSPDSLDQRAYNENQKLQKYNQEQNQKASEVRSAKAQINLVKSQLTPCEHKPLTGTSTEVVVSNKHLFDKISEQSLQNRANLLADLRKQVNKQDIVKTIYSCGFDADHLAYLAISRNETDLLDIALEHGADCAAYKNSHTGASTLLQYASDLGLEHLVTQILESEQQDIDSCLLNAIKYQDLNSLNKIISNDKEILYKQINELTLLHSAIDANKHDVIKYLLSLDKSLIDVRSYSGQLPIEAAIKFSDAKTLDILVEYVDLEQIALASIKFGPLETFNLLLDRKLIDEDVKYKLLSFALKEHYVETAHSILKACAHLELVLVKAYNSEDIEIRSNLIEIIRRDPTIAQHEPLVNKWLEEVTLLDQFNSLLLTNDNNENIENAIDVTGQEALHLTDYQL